MATQVTSRFADDRITFVRDFPASQAALARIAGPVAARFEPFWGGSNSPTVSTNSATRPSRSGASPPIRREARPGQPVRDADRAFLAALDSGLPPCAGVALGFDRVVMVAAGADRIDEVIAFPSSAPDARTEHARMHTLTELPTDKDAAYAELAASLRALLDGEHDLVANAANIGGPDLLEPARAQLGGSLSRGAAAWRPAARAVPGASRRACASARPRGVRDRRAAARDRGGAGRARVPGHIACDSRRTRRSSFRSFAAATAGGARPRQPGPRAPSTEADARGLEALVAFSWSRSAADARRRAGRTQEGAGAGQARLSSWRGTVLARARVDANDLALVDEERHPDTAPVSSLAGSGRRWRCRRALPGRSRRSSARRAPARWIESGWPFHSMTWHITPSLSHCADSAIASLPAVCCSKTCPAP